MSLHQQLRQHLALPGAARQRLFLLAEASAIPGLTGRLAFHGTDFRYLWHLVQNPALKRHAPVLLELLPESDLDLWLCTLGDTLALTRIETNLALEPLARHLRQFGKVQQGHQRYFLRLGDPRALSLYVRSLANQADALAWLFDHGRVHALHFHAPSIGLAIAAQPLFEQVPQGCERQGYLAWFGPAKAYCP